VGTNVFAYTAQFGNGFSATIAAEDSSFRRSPVIDTPTVGGIVFNTATATDSIGSKAPDVVANLRIDQAWGSAQVQAAGHIVGGRYYSTTYAAHPDDKWGSAFGAGASFNLPMLGKGDTVSVVADWCNGAVRYCVNPSTGNGTGLVFGVRNGGTVAIGEAWDGSFGAAGTSIDLSKTWSIAAGYQHFWSPAWRTSVYSQYLSYKASSSVVDASCINISLSAGCEDFKGFQVGTRTQWNPVAELDVGVDLMYSRAQTAMSGRNVTFGGNGATAVQGTLGDVSVWSAFFRVQRNFVP
jgi:hypothetical protein